jgi:D-lactate dehydrogenase (cytochrome)
MSHRIQARGVHAAGAPSIVRDPAVVSGFLDDAAHVPGGFASGVSFPASEAEVAALMARAAAVLPVGAQSSLTGGATPRGEVVLSTRALRRLEIRGNSAVRVGAGMPLAELQRALAAVRLYYPPVPTFDGAFVGGTIATNAAGAATFKYGSTRPWVEAVTVVLASGDVLDIDRGATTAGEHGGFEITAPDGTTRRVPVPGYSMPAVAKLSAGYYARPGMDLIDLFIGAEGTLGVVMEATLRVIPRPRRCLALVRCAGDDQAVRVTAALRTEAGHAWKGNGPLDIAAIEFMDARALANVPGDAFARAAVSRPAPGDVMLLVQVEVGADADAALARLSDILDASGVSEDPILAPPDDDRAAERLLALREAVPASVNALVASRKGAHPEIEKTAGDMVVPFDRLIDSIALYRRTFESRELPYAIWGHVSDGNLHPNVVPGSTDDVRRGREAILEMAREVIAMGGAPLAEHGVGRSALKQRLLQELYGSHGIEEMRAVKRALDPGWKLAPGVLFTARDGGNT